MLVTDRHDLPLGRCRRAGRPLVSLVDLEGVGGERDRVLAALAQLVGERDGDRGLTDPGGAEDGYYRAQPTRASRLSSPASVVLVAESICTRANAPGAATPAKFTVLLWRIRPRKRDGSVR